MNEFDLQSLTGLLRRQRFTIAVTVIAVLGLVILALSQIPSRYSATTLVMIDPREQRLVSLDNVTPAPPNIGAVDGEVEIMASPVIARRVIARLNLQDDEEFNRPDLLTQIAAGLWPAAVDGSEGQAQPGQPLPPRVERRIIDRLARRVDIARRGVTSIIAIEASSRDPDKAARIANAYAQAYIEDQIASRLRLVANAERVLASRVTDLGEELRRAEAELDRFTLEQAMERMGEDGRNRLVSLRTALEEDIAARTDALARLRTLEPLVQDADTTGIARALAGGESDALTEERREIERQLSAGRLPPARVTALRTRIAAIDARIVALGRARTEELQRAADASEQRAQQVRRDLDMLVNTSDLPADASVQLYKLREEVAANRALYQNYLGRLRQVSQQRGLVLADSRIVAEAMAAVRPSFPPTLPILVASLFLAFGAGFGIAWVRDTFGRGFLKADEVEEATGLDVVASLPQVESARAAVPVQDKVVREPGSGYAEAIRRLRLGLDILMSAGEGEAGGKVVLVTSTKPGEGKSVTAVALGRAAALAGRRTLLIDCDLRKPSVHRLLKVDVKTGLVDILADRATTAHVNDVRVIDPLSDMSAFISGDAQFFPAESILDSARFRALLEGCRKAFDVIILDAPPLAVVSDPLLLAVYADVVLYVVHWKTTTQREVLQSLKELRRVKGETVYVALNGVAAASGEGSYYPYAAKGRKPGGSA